VVTVNSLDKFADKYLVKSSRLNNWDYSASGFYFITICTLNHNNFFGKIINEEMKLSKIGEIVYDEWFKTEKIRKNIKLNSFVIMPNHIHLLIKIKNQIEPKDNYCRDVLQNVSTDKQNNSKYFSLISPKSNSISNIIKMFKSSVTRRINPKLQFFAWQTRFHDHIIRNQKEYFTIKKYIQNNIKNWEKDELFFKI
jgi:putative transposase